MTINWLVGLPVVVLIIVSVVTIHELGHFLAARITGVKVKQFAIGLPPPLWTFKLPLTLRWRGNKIGWQIPIAIPPQLFRIPIGETLFTVNLCPLGGACEFEEGKDDPRSLPNASKKARALIYVGGLLGNFVGATVSFALMYLALGKPTISSLIWSPLAALRWTSLTAEVFLSTLFRFDFSQLGSVVAVSQITAEAATRGSESGNWEYVFFLSAAINVSLLVFNALPLPPLDGGRLLLLFIEALQGKLHQRVEKIFNVVGLALMIALAVFVIVKDLIVGVPHLPP